MAVLVEGFTIVVRIAAIDALCPGGWDGFWREVPGETARNDGYLAAVSFATRPELRDVLERMARLGFADAGTLLEATERTPGRVFTAEQTAERFARLATPRDLALVYRLQTVRPEWVESALGT